jgi:hypothetical protein
VAGDGAVGGLDAGRQGDFGGADAVGGGGGVVDGGDAVLAAEAGAQAHGVGDHFDAFGQLGVLGVGDVEDAVDAVGIAAPPVELRQHVVHDLIVECGHAAPSKANRRRARGPPMIAPARLVASSLPLSPRDVYAHFPIDFGSIRASGHSFGHRIWQSGRS